MFKPQYFFSILLFIPLLVVQVTLLPLLAVKGIIPDLILILLVYYAITQGQIYGTVLGFIYGFIFDLISGSLLGSTMISKTLAGFTAGYFSSENKRDQYLEPFNFSLIVLLCALIDSTIYAFFSAIDFNTNMLILFFEHSFLPAFYSGLISLLVMIFLPKRRAF